MKRKYFILIIGGILFTARAHANWHCVVNTCNSGYYLSSSILDQMTGQTYYKSCSRCPGLTASDGTMKYGTTPAGYYAITECALSGGKYLDNTGVYEFTSPCKYKD